MGFALKARRREWMEKVEVSVERAHTMSGARSRNLFIGNVPFEQTEEQLYDVSIFRKRRLSSCANGLVSRSSAPSARSSASGEFVRSSLHMQKELSTPSPDSCLTTAASPRALAFASTATPRRRQLRCATCRATRLADEPCASTLQTMTLAPSVTVEA